MRVALVVFFAVDTVIVLKKEEGVFSLFIGFGGKWPLYLIVSTYNILL